MKVMQSTPSLVKAMRFKKFLHYLAYLNRILLRNNSLNIYGIFKYFVSVRLDSVPSTQCWSGLRGFHKQMTPSVAYCVYIVNTLLLHSTWHQKYTIDVEKAWTSVGMCQTALPGWTTKHVLKQALQHICTYRIFPCREDLRQYTIYVWF